MSDVKPALLELYAHEDGSASTAEAEDLHCLPMPQEDHAIDAGLLDAMARFQVHSLTVLSKLPQAATSTVSSIYSSFRCCSDTHDPSRLNSD